MFSKVSAAKLVSSEVQMVVAPSDVPAGMVMEATPPTLSEKLPVRMPSKEISLIGSLTATATTVPWSSFTSCTSALSEMEKLVQMSPDTVGVP